MILDFIHFHAIVLLWATTTIHSETKPLIVNKCCPEGEILNDNLECISSFDQYSDFANQSIEDFPWFPIDAIVNSTTLKIHEHHTDNYLKILKNKYEINAGVKPDCGKNYRLEMNYFQKGRLDLFHLIMYENYSFSIHNSKPATLGDPKKDLILFERINQTKEMDNEVYSKIENAKYENSEEKYAHNVRWDSFKTFPLEDACVDMSTYKFHFLLYCPCRYTTCIRKCCFNGQILNEIDSLCEDIPETNTRDIPNWRPKMDGMKSQYYLLSSTFPACKDPLILKLPLGGNYKKCKSFNKESDNEFKIFSNGSVKVNKYKNPFPPDQYCGEVTWHDNGTIYEQNLLICSGSKKNQYDDLKPVKFRKLRRKKPARRLPNRITRKILLSIKRAILYGILLILGGICLLITVAVSLLLPELRRRIHNKIALSHNASLMVAYFAWGIAQLSPNLGPKSCIFISLLIQFTFLGSFFWLNVMCIDISMTFSATRSLGGNSNRGMSKKFFLYCLYSWGTASIITIITMIMEFVDEVPYYVLRPGFTCSCGFNTETASILIYFYGPMAVLLLFNLVLFIFTSIKIMTIQRQTAILHKTESNTSGGVSYQTDKQRYDLMQWLILYAKLFLLMGLTWVTEIVSWAVGGPDYYWYFSDSVNLLRAVFIFILFICKRPVLLSLRRKITGESFSFSNKTGSSKSTTDVLSITTSGRDSRFRSSTSSSKRRDTCGKIEMENQKNTMSRQMSEILSKNFNSFEESRI